MTSNVAVGKCGSPFRDVSVYLMSSGCGHEFMLPSDTARAMFTLRDAGVENMIFSNGIETYTFGKSPVCISTCWRHDSHSLCRR